MLSRKTLGLSGLLLLFFVLLLPGWFHFCSVPVRIGAETTILTEPRTADGRQIDYAAYFQSQYPAEMKTEKNAARAFARLLGSLAAQGEGVSAEESARLKTQLFEGLGLKPTDPRFALSDVRKAYEKFLQEKPLGAGDLPQNEKESEFQKWKNRQERGELSLFEPADLERNAAFAREWVRDASSALDALSEAVALAEFCRFPFQSLNEKPLAEDLLPLDCLQMLPRIAWGLAFRAQWRVLEGNSDGAVSDLLTCRRLGWLTLQEPCTLMEFERGLQVEFVANSISIAANPQAPLSAEQWRRLMDFSFGPERKNALRESLMVFERFSIPCLLQAASRNPDSVNRQWLLQDEPSGWRPGVDWNVIVREWNLAFQKAFLEEDFSHFQLREFEEKLEQKRLVLKPAVPEFQTRQHFSLYLGQKIKRFLRHLDLFEALQQADCQDQMLRIGCAMQLYRLDHAGHFPPACSRNPEGKPLHSWRVLLLPYLGEDALFAKIRLDEPWDSPWNARFHAQIPGIFVCPEKRKAELLDQTFRPGDTIYSVLIGEQACADPILVTERPKPDCWMKPDSEWSLEAFEAAPHLGPCAPKMTVFSSGCVRKLN